MKRSSLATAIVIVVVFIAGFVSHLLYLRWNPSSHDNAKSFPGSIDPRSQSPTLEPQSHRVTFVPLSPPAERPADLPLLQARDVEKIRGLAGRQARIRGRVFRVGHSGKSNTYFLNFGPSRAALTAVIFASAVEMFEKNKLSPKHFEGRDVEVQGEIKDHPQYGLELILENPSQIKLMD